MVALDFPILVMVPVLLMNRPVDNSLTGSPTFRGVPVLSVDVGAVVCTGVGTSVSPSSVDISCKVVMIRLVSRARSFNFSVSSSTLPVCIELFYG